MLLFAGAMNQVHVNALFGRLVKLVCSSNVRPLDMLALPNMLPQVRKALYDCNHSTADTALTGVHQQRAAAGHAGPAQHAASGVILGALQFAVDALQDRLSC
jgi:membrane-associated PAP2 superfamily phosphatase